MSKHVERLQQLEQAATEAEFELEDKERWYRNEYTCWRCGHIWEDIWSGTPDDDCPECGAGGCSPEDSTEVDGPEG